MARILLGVTGGIAAYKACEVLRLLVKGGHDVLPLPTPGAERFVTAETFFALARTQRSSDPYPHLERADALVIAPLTANTLAKLAHGLADNVLTEAALASALAGKHVLVTAGGTREPLDAVRFLGNRSSGRMGVAVAVEARRRGAAVTLLAANVAVPVPDGIDVVETPTADDVAREARARAAAADVVVMAAAVADYRPTQAVAGKRAKDEKPWNLSLEPTVDVLRMLGARDRNGQVLVGFGAEVGAGGLNRKRTMLHDKNVDLVVYNDVGRNAVGFDAAENEVVLITREGEREVTRAPKEQIAAAVLDEVERLLQESHGGS